MFDTTRTFGHKPFRLDDRAKRLFRSLKATGIDPGLTPEGAALQSRSLTIHLPESRMAPSLAATLRELGGEPTWD